MIDPLARGGHAPGDLFDLNPEPGKRKRRGYTRMGGSTFTTNPRLLKDLLKHCDTGKLQLPDFQRGWVWDEDRIVSLIASIARAFPVGTLMTLKSDTGVGRQFAHRAIEGTAKGIGDQLPSELLLDGQQRMTSLYQSCFVKSPVRTVRTQGDRPIERYFYIDIYKALADPDDIEAAIVAVPADRCQRTNFGREVVLDLSTPEREYQAMMYPVNQVFDWDDWYDGITDYARASDKFEVTDDFKRFKNTFLKNFDEYQVPVIALSADTSSEAVCRVFEKVNTGGKALDAFELLTAMYAARSYRLRDDWLGPKGQDGAYTYLNLQRRLAMCARSSGRETGVLSEVAATDFLQAVTLLQSKAQRIAAERAWPDDRSRWPAVRATRQTLLALPLEAYCRYRDAVLHGFEEAAKFLTRLGIYHVKDVPYGGQLVPLAALFADLGQKAESAPVKEKLERWYWCGVFGESYGGANEARYARDLMEVPAWIDGGDEPDTVQRGILNPERLWQLRTRGSAAYKGLHALLLRLGARDFRTGQTYDLTRFFDETVDIHHIFPKAWCEGRGITAARYDNVLNKTPISYRTNRIIGGNEPSSYLARLERGSAKDAPIPAGQLDGYLASHAIPVAALRADDFETFLIERQKELMRMVCQATGQSFPTEWPSPGSDRDEAAAEQEAEAYIRGETLLEEV